MGSNQIMQQTEMDRPTRSTPVSKYAVKMAAKQVLFFSCFISELSFSSQQRFLGVLHEEYLNGRLHLCLSHFPQEPRNTHNPIIAGILFQKRPWISVAAAITFEQEWCKSTVPPRNGYQQSNLPMSLPAMQQEQHLSNLATKLQSACLCTDNEIIFKSKMTDSNTILKLFKISFV